MNYTPGKTTLILLMFFMLVIGIVELVFGNITNSQILKIESFHSLADLGSLTVVVISYYISTHQWSRSTFGFARAEIVGMFVNCVFFAGCSLTVGFGCFGELFKKEPIRMPKWLLIVGCLGFCLHIMELIIFHFFRTKTSNLNLDNHSHNQVKDWLSIQDENSQSSIEERDQNECKGFKSIVLILINDVLVSLVVVILGLIFEFFEIEELYYLDPVCALFLITLIIYTMWPIFKQSAYILLQTVPLNITISDLKNRLITEIPEILSMHELHIWQLRDSKIIATLHIRCKNLENYIKIQPKVKEFFKREGIYSTTIQPEFKADPCIKSSKYPYADEECLLICPSFDRSCLLKSCCGQLRFPELFESD